MMPVKSISLLSGFNLQDESLIPFEQVVLDSSLAVNRYSVSSDNAKYNNLFAGDLEDEDLYLEVSYKDKTTGNYVPRKFDFSNYLRYVENALSILNNGIMGVYLTKAQADELYVRRTGDTMTGPLEIALSPDKTDSTSAPLVISDSRTTTDLNNSGSIQIKGTNHSLILLYNSDNSLAIRLEGNPGSGNMFVLNNVLTATSTNITVNKPLTAKTAKFETAHITDTPGSPGSLQLKNTSITTGALSADNGITVSEGNIEVTSSSGTITAVGNITSSSGTVKGSVIESSSELKGASLNIPSVITASSTEGISLSADTSIGTETDHKTLTIHGNAIGSVIESSGVLRGASLDITSVITASSTDGISLLKTTTLGITDGSPANFTISNGNIIMDKASSTISFGSDSDSPTISYSTAESAFVITSLVVGTAAATDAPGSFSWTPGTAAALKIKGHASCTNAILSQYLVAGTKLYVHDFEARDITATGTFTQENGIANLTAKRACWA